MKRDRKSKNQDEMFESEPYQPSDEINEDLEDENVEPSCDEKCSREENCSCDENCSCENECTCEEKASEEEVEGAEENVEKNNKGQNKAEEYLEMARRIQAEFDNFRRRTEGDLEKARQDGEIKIIEAFLPCLDTFKLAKKSITDPTVLEGVEMIENNIVQTLKKLGVEKIEAVGQQYDHNLHNVIALTKVDDKEDGIILDEYQAGYKYNGKVIRYSKVIVNKKED